MNRAKKKLIKDRSEMLKNSDKSMKSVFNVIFCDKKRIFAQYTYNSEIKKVTFGELYELILKYAFYINKKAQISHRYIGIDSENCMSWVAAFWGVLLSGNKPFLVNCKHPENLKKDFVKTLNIPLVIGLKSHELGCEYSEYAEIEKLFDCEEFSGEEFVKCTDNLYKNEFENEMALVSSATSLRETVAVYDGEALSNSVLNAEYILKNNKRMPKYYKGALRQLAFLPFYHIFGFSAVYLWFTFYGCTMVFLENYSGDTITKTARDHGVTHIFAVPLLWNTVEARVRKQAELQGEKTVKKLEKGMDLSEKIQKIFPYAGEVFARRLFRDITDKTFGRGVRFCISGGASVKDSTVRFFNCIGYPMHNGYGMTETGITSVCLEKNIKDRNSNSVGYPFPSVKYILGDDGELSIDGTSLCKKRIINGEIVEINGHFVTEDIFRSGENGYYILGRKNDVIIGADGENINPDTAEKNITVPFMQRFCIFKDKTGDREVPALVVELKKICTPAQIAKTAEDVKASCERMPVQFRPVNIYYTFDLISSPEAVKISRNYLKKCIEDGSVKLIKENELPDYDANSEKFDENTELARTVRKIIAEALCRKEEEIAADANVITDLGGSSLDYFYIMSQIGDKTGISLYTDETHCPYTLRDFCREIEAQM